jgi:F-type H+-transporting ATPase subunit gamma
MPSLKEVKIRIGSVVSTQQITKAMKMVAAAKLRRSQDKVLQIRPFANKLTALLRNLLTAQEGKEADNWYSKVRPEKNILIVTITSDRGLCGSFNSNVFKGTLKMLADNYDRQLKEGTVTILPLGKKALEFFTKRKYIVVRDYVDVYRELSFDHVSEIGEYILREFREERYDKVEVVYNEFKNIATQVLRKEQILPVPQFADNRPANQVDYIYEPNEGEILTGLIPKVLKVQLYKALLDSNAAENAARMTAMDKATENAGELLKELRLTYNRTRQAAITKEILEIVGGAEALKSA